MAGFLWNDDGGKEGSVMHYRLTGVHDKEDKEWLERFGTYNAVPPGFIRISELEFSRSNFFTYMPKYVEHRQVRLNQKYVNLYMYYFHDHTGIAMSSDQQGVKYYKFFLCQHELKEISRQEAEDKGIYHGGTMYHVEICQKCDYVHAYDSSG